jgi:hypothetical protein
MLNVRLKFEEDQIIHCEFSEDSCLVSRCFHLVLDPEELLMENSLHIVSLHERLFQISDLASISR